MAPGAGVRHEAGRGPGTERPAHLRTAGTPAQLDHSLMTCYLISRGGEAIALVTDLGMARAIARCQPAGEYRVDKLDIVDAAPVRESRPPRPAPEFPDGRYRRRPSKAARRWSFEPAMAAFDRARHRSRRGRVRGSDG
jgi:hypothetical protein